MSEQNNEKKVETNVPAPKPESVKKVEEQKMVEGVTAPGQTSFTPGYKAVAKIGANVVYCTSFEHDVTFKTTDVGTTGNTGSPTQEAMSRSQVKFTGEGWVDVTATNMNGTLAGTQQSVSYSHDGSGTGGTVNFTCATCNIVSFKATAAQGDFVKYTFTGSSSGAYTVA